MGSNDDDRVREQIATIDRALDGVRPTAQGVIWVCVGCLLARETGEPTEPCGCTPACEPWSREPDTDVTAGLDCGTPDHWKRDDDDHTECETREFSWSSCDGCGCTLGGSRHAYTWWA